MIRFARFFLLLFVLITSTAFADQFDSKTWRTVKTYDMAELGKLDPPPLGHIVGVKFNYRHERIDQPHIGWYLGSIWHVVRGSGKADFMHISVMVRERDLAAFKAITNDSNSTQTRVVYGEPEYYRDSSFVFLRLIGTKVKHGKHGMVTVTW
jgi:hypothetical protein